MKAMMFTYFSRSYLDWVHAGIGQLKTLEVRVHGSWVGKPRPPQEHCPLPLQGAVFPRAMRDGIISARP